MERFKNESSGNTKAPDFTLAKTKPVFKKRIDLPTIALLPSGHYAKEYLKIREIPLDRLNDIYYAANFKDFIKDLVPDCDKTLYDEPRIVIPFYDEEKNLLGVQGRAIGDSKIKYITIKTHEDNKKIFGLDRVDLSKRIYVVEGPLDSMFLQNSVAMMDADLLDTLRQAMAEALYQHRARQHRGRWSTCTFHHQPDGGSMPFISGRLPMSFTPNT
jgi:hypothetical protein